MIETALILGLLPEEFDRICKILNREPNFTETCIFSVMWSEHCSYKNSIVWLKTLPKGGASMLAKAGEENAGMVDLGDGLACVFKIESHNHPSAIEPYQGAATGVGGINRDIFTMGARPVAQLNSLRFGNLTNERTKWLLRGVVKGIGDYGNAFGIPTVGGELYFDDTFTVNPLVNAMSVGIVEVGHTVSATSTGPGNLVYIVGSATGKDGIHGAAFASKDISGDSVKDLPSVQVGDPFQEKLLLEASLEVIRTGALIGMQDMGAAGIICTNSEMSAKGEHGMDINLDAVPLRNESMEPFEILLSESQERMLIVVKKGREQEVESIFDKWDLNCACIGEVTQGKMLRYFHKGHLVAQVPASDLVLGGGAPVYYREYSKPAYIEEYSKFSIEEVIEPKNLREVAEQLITQPNIASKKWVTNQYDSTVGTVTLTGEINPSDAAVVNLRGTNKALALTVDCNSRYVYADPFKGTQIAVAEAARNIVCSGGKPLAITNCLNFGNPYNPQVYWQFVEAIKGMALACERLGTPVTGGNVSFYNQSEDGGAVFPTPTIGMMGILDDKKDLMTLNFKQAGDVIYLVGKAVNDISSSEYLVSFHGIKKSGAPYFDLDEELKVQEFITAMISKRLPSSVHDIADGGLYVCLVESCLTGILGFDIITLTTLRKDAFLFGEAQSRVVISITAEQEEIFKGEALAADQEILRLGVVTTGELIVDGAGFGEIGECSRSYNSVLDGLLNTGPVELM